jgi:hypothetical protein
MRLFKQRDHLFTFLDHPEVDATNNLAERQLRARSHCLQSLLRKQNRPGSPPVGNPRQLGSHLNPAWRILRQLVRRAALLSPGR